MRPSKTYTLKSNYDGKTADVLVHLHAGTGNSGWISKAQLRRAEKRAGVVSGDYFPLPSFSAGNDFEIDIR
jgi:hypothetical protein